MKLYRHGSTIFSVLVLGIFLVSCAQVKQLPAALQPSPSAATSATASPTTTLPLPPAVSAQLDPVSEMTPDRSCSRPREKFNVMEKLFAFGGDAAKLRLKTLVASDFKYSSLTDADKKMLEYLAKTTMWVPPDVEIKLARIASFRDSAELSPYEQETLETLQKRFENLRTTSVADYPAEIQLKVDPKLTDGAFAKFGGVIVLSSSFLDGLSDSEQAADFLLAHEVSHVYKRHALKNIQHRLISTEEGWNIAKGILRHATLDQKWSPTRAIEEGIYTARTVPQLIDFIKKTQINYAQDQEFEADGCAVVWLKAIHVDPIVAWKEYQKILGTLEAYSSTHPSTADREANYIEVSSRVQ